MGVPPHIKAVFWVSRFWPAMGGTELHSAELAQRLSSRITVEVINHCEKTANIKRTLNTDALDTTDDQYQLNSIRVNRIGLSSINMPLVRWLARIHPSYRFARAIFTLLYNAVVPKRTASTLKDANLIHFIYNGLTDAAVQAYVSSRRQNIPFVLTPNVLDTSDNSTAWNSRRFRRLYKKADAIIALTKHEADYVVRQGANPDKITVIPYGPVLNETGNAASGRAAFNLFDKRIILFLGRVVELKGYALLLEAFEHIKQQHPDTALVFMGPASIEITKQLQHRDAQDIYLIDSPDQQLKADMLSAAELVCVPSCAESLGVVYLEAFACKKPVVALDLPVLRDVISDQQDGLLINRSVTAVEEAVCKLLSDPEMAKRMGQAGFEKVNTQYTWESVENAVLGVYAEVLEQANSAETLHPQRVESS